MVWCGGQCVADGSDTQSDPSTCRVVRQEAVDGDQFRTIGHQTSEGQAIGCPSEVQVDDLESVAVASFDHDCQDLGLASLGQIDDLVADVVVGRSRHDGVAADTHDGDGHDLDDGGADGGQMTHLFIGWLSGTAGR